MNSTNFACAGGLHLLEERGERIADPRDHHGPGLHAAERVDALLERRQLQELLDVEAARLGAEPFHLHRPGPRAQRARVARRVFLVGAELVEVVVGGGALESGLRLGEAHRRVLLGGQRLALRGRRRAYLARQGGQCRRPRDEAAGDEAPPIQIERPRRHVRVLEHLASLDHHGGSQSTARWAVVVTGLSDRARPQAPRAVVADSRHINPLGMGKGPEILPGGGTCPLPSEHADACSGLAL